MAVVLSSKPGGSGGGGAPSGPAGGSLSGTYPNPGLEANAKGDLLVATAADTVAPLTVGANDTVLRADSSQASGVEWAYPPGYELDYAQNATDVTISSTSSPGDAVVALPARTYNGTMIIMLEFFCAQAATGATDESEIIAELFDSTTLLFRIASMRTETAESSKVTWYSRVRLTPSAASHTYNVKAWRVASNGVLNGLPGQAPIFLRSTVVSS